MRRGRRESKGRWRGNLRGQRIMKNAASIPPPPPVCALVSLLRSWACFSALWPRAPSSYVEPRACPQPPQGLFWPSAQSCSVTQLRLPFREPIGCSSPGFSVHGSFQVRTLDWIAVTYSRGSSPPRDHTCISCISCIDRPFLYHCAT